MDEKTRSALELSIEHWERMATGKQRMHEQPGISDCKLCILYYGNSCVGCPISEDTGQKLCRGSPYQAAWNEYETRGINSEEFRAAAIKMKEYLERLRDV